MSETSKCRERLKKYCVGYGLDVGYGGDPIVPSAITMDMPTPYTKVGPGAPLNLGGDARDLKWFRDNALDYVYSSHLLEDYTEGDMKTALSEWLRVIRPEGYLILYCPVEAVYRKHCDKAGEPYNLSHKYEGFNLDFVKRLLNELGGKHAIAHENPLVDDYSFEIVIKKKGGYGNANKNGRRGCGLSLVKTMLRRIFPKKSV